MDHRAGQTGRPVGTLIIRQLLITVRSQVERILQRQIELDVRKRGLRVGEVGVGAPGVVGEVEHQRGIRLAGVAAEEGGAGGGVGVDEGLDVWDDGEVELAAGLVGGEVAVVEVGAVDVVVGGLIGARVVGNDEVQAAGGDLKGADGDGFAAFGAVHEEEVGGVGHFGAGGEVVEWVGPGGGRYVSEKVALEKAEERLGAFLTMCSRERRSRRCRTQKQSGSAERRMGSLPSQELEGSEYHR